MLSNYQCKYFCSGNIDILALPSLRYKASRALPAGMAFGARRLPIAPTAAVEAPPFLSAYLLNSIEATQSPAVVWLSPPGHEPQDSI